MKDVYVGIIEYLGWIVNVQALFKLVSQLIQLCLVLKLHNVILYFFFFFGKLHTIFEFNINKTHHFHVELSALVYKLLVFQSLCLQSSGLSLSSVHQSTISSMLSNPRFPNRSCPKPPMSS